MIWSLPVLDELPEQLRGAPYVGVAGMWAGDPAEGERATRGLRELATPLLDMSGRVEYLDFQRSLDPFFPAGVRRYWKALYLDGFSEAAIETTVDWSQRRPSNDTLVIVRHCGGAIARVGAEQTAFGDRSSEWMLSIDSTWHDPADDAANIDYTRAFWNAATPFSDGKTYFNFPGLHEEGDAAVRDSYGANHARLARIKAAYDPENASGSTRTSAPPPKRLSLPNPRTLPMNPLLTHQLAGERQRDLMAEAARARSTAPARRRPAAPCSPPSSPPPSRRSRCRRPPRPRPSPPARRGQYVDRGFFSGFSAEKNNVTISVLGSSLVITDAAGITVDANDADCVQSAPSGDAEC